MDDPYQPPLTAVELPAASPLLRLPAGFGQRLVAKALDGFLVYVAFVVFWFVLSSAWKGWGKGSPAALQKLDDFKGFSAIILFWLYAAVMESSQWHATFWKMALGLKVTTLSEQRISFLRASGRYFGQFLSFAFGWIGFVMMIATREKQTLHDMMAGCYVTDARK